MAVTPIKLPRLPANQKLINADGTPTLVYSRWWQSVVQQVEQAINGIIALPEIQAAIDEAQAAADAANAAAADAADATVANAKEAALVNSYLDPSSVLTASTTTITVAGHIRHYADGTTATITGGTVAATAMGDTDYVSYSDPTRAGGAVTFIVSTAPPTQTGNTHVIGAVIIPSTGTAAGGDGPRRPGFVEP
jgi:hypothetical protein